MLHVNSDASVRDGVTGLGYSMKTRSSTGKVEVIEQGWKRLDLQHKSYDAEYMAVVLAAESALRYDVEYIMFYTDCASVAESIRERRGIHHNNTYRDRFESAVKHYEDWDIFWLPSSQNVDAHIQSRKATGNWR